MGKERVSLNTFSSRSPKIFDEDDVDELFNVGNFKRSQSAPSTSSGREHQEVGDLVTATSCYDDIFDGLSESQSSGTMEDEQTREDEDILSDAKTPSSAFHVNHDDYEGVREGGLTDEESFTVGSESYDMSSMPSVETSLFFGRNGTQTPLACVDDSALLQLLELGAQLGANIDETNQFLLNELDMAGFVEEIKDLQEEVMNNGLEKLNKVEWANLFRSLYDSTKGVPSGEHLALASEAEDCEGLPKTQPSSAQGQDPLAGLMQDMNDFVLEEGMEMTYFSCGNCGDNPTEELAFEAKKKSILKKLFTGHHQKRVTPRALASGAPSLKPSIMRVRFEDGSMASVDKNTAAVSQSPSLKPSSKRVKFEDGLMASVDKNTAARAASETPSLKANVMRVKLEDGSMASVDKDTAARLQNCYWV